MKTKIKKNLLSVLVATTAVTTLAATAVLIKPTFATTVAADTRTTRFEMVDGASIRYSQPLGLRFIAELGQQEYDDLNTTESGVTKEMGMFITPWEFVDTDSDGEIDVADYASIGSKLDYVFFSSDGDAEGELYQYEDESGDVYYRANGVIQNLKLQNYAREFVGIGYIAETKDGQTTYRYTDITYADNVRTSAYVAIEAHADPDYQDIDNAMSVFTQYIDGAQLYSAYGVTQNANGKFVYNTAEYDTLEAIKNTIDNYAYGISLDKGVKYVKADGTAQLNATLSDTLNNVTFKGAHAVYRSSDESVVKVDKTGKLTHIKNGTATITAEFMGKTQTCDVISGAIDFETMTEVPDYMSDKSARIENFSIVEMNGSKVLQAQTTTSSTTDVGVYITTEVLGAFFEDPTVQYVGFDLKSGATKTGNTVYYHANGSSFTKYETGTYDSIDTNAFKTYYFSREFYQGWVNNNVTSARFIMIGGSLVCGGESFYLDNFRAVTADEYSANTFYSFENGGLRVNDGGRTLLFYKPSTSDWAFNMQVESGKVFTDPGYTNEGVTDGIRALTFTKEAGSLSINFTDGKVAYTDIVTKTGYWAFDVYVPEGADTTFTYHTTTWTGVTPTKGGWTTFYVKDSKNQVVLSDTTGGTYKVDNIRSITAEEYKTAAYSFEANTGGLRDNVEASNVWYYYIGADHSANRYSICSSSSALTGVSLSSERAHSGNYSLSFTKKNGELNLQMRADSNTYAELKNGFSFWLYSTVAINGTGTDNFDNGNNTKPNGGAGYFINANTWTKIVLTADDIVQKEVGLTENNACAFLRIKGSTAGTYYLDGFQPLEGNTVTLDAGVGSVESATATLYTGVSYTLETPTYNEYLYEFVGWYYGEELVPTTGVWNIEGDVTLTAKYEDATQSNFYKSTYENIDDNGVTGLTLQASSYTGSNMGSLPQLTDYTEDMSYYRFGGEYGLNDFLVLDFTGKNMPLLTFFNNSVTNTIYNHAQNADVKGWLVTNGITLADGSYYGGATGAHCNRISLCGPYMISYTYDDNGENQPITQVRTSIGSAAEPNPAAMAQLVDTHQYRAIVGWVESGTNMKLRLFVWDMTTGEVLTDVTSNGVAIADWEGDIVLYGQFGKATVVDNVYPIVEGFDNAKALYAPAYVTYKATKDGNQITLAQSTTSGAVNRPDVGTQDMSYIAYNGDYGYGDYLVFDFTGSNLPIISFFNNAVTNTVYNNASKTANAAGAKDANAHGVMICGGLYNIDGTIYGSGDVNACRLIVVGHQKVLGWDDNSNTQAGGFRSTFGSTSDVNPLSVTALQSVTDTYRVIIGFSAKGKLDVCAINMVTGAQVYKVTLSVGATQTKETGSIALHGQFGKTTVLDRVFGVEENTTMDALITKYAKDTDYSDEESVVLSRYAYSSISDGTYTVDGTSYCSTCGNAISDSHSVCTDFRNDPNSYTTYKEAGFNVMLPQSAVDDSNAEVVKTAMENAATAGLKVILTDWQLQTLSTPIKITSDGPAAANSTYAPWILASDASATTGLAADWLTQLSEMGITADTDRFADRAALDAYVKTQLSAYNGYEAFLGVMLGDEPSYHNAYCYGEIYQSIKRVMPECYVQYNLLPLEQNIGTIQYRYPGLNSSSTAAEIENAYKQYVELFVDALGTDYIQYDDYPFKSSTESYLWGLYEEVNPYIDNTSLRNIQLVAEIAKERGLDVKVVTQSSLMLSGEKQYVHIRQITEDDARWLNNYLMGFGVKQINYFTYWTKSANSSTGETFVDGGSFVNKNGTKTDVYTWYQAIMAENDKFSNVIGYFDYSESKVVGSDTDSSLNNDHITWNSSAVVNADATFRWVSGVTTDKEFTLVTELYDAERYNYMYMVMNTIDPNYGGTQSVTVTFDSSITEIYVYQPDGTVTTVALTDNAYTVTLTAGQAVYMLPKF